MACLFSFAQRNFGEIMGNRKNPAVEISAAFISFSPGNGLPHTDRERDFNSKESVHAATLLPSWVLTKGSRPRGAPCFVSTIVPRFFGVLPTGLRIGWAQRILWRLVPVPVSPLSLRKTYSQTWPL